MFDYHNTGAVLSSLCQALRHIALTIVMIIYIYISNSFQSSRQGLDTPNTGMV